MDVLYFAFANDPNHPLEELKREDSEINRLLEPLAASGRFRIVRDQYATLDMVADKLRTYQKQLVLFHYSGHAASNVLELEAGPARALGIGELIRSCPNLEIVVLNGCATIGQVEFLQQKYRPDSKLVRRPGKVQENRILSRQVAAVIATERRAEDHKAASFAIQFYRALSYFDHLEAAFQIARAYVLALDHCLLLNEATRGLALRGAPTQTPCWGLSLLDGREDVLKWRLPQYRQVSYNVEPNHSLLKALLNTLAPYRPEIKKIVEDEQLGNVWRNTQKSRAVLEALPHPVSELLRYLLTPRSPGIVEMEFFDQPGLSRLRQMVALFVTVMELVASIMLAELWDKLKENPKLSIDDNTRQAIQRLFHSSNNERQGFDFLTLIASIKATLEKNCCLYFVEELRTQKETFEPGHPFYEACQFFSGLHLRLNTLTSNVAHDLSMIAEEKLVAVLMEIGFIGRYTIASVKNIDVLKYRHEKTYRFNQRIVPLVQTFVGLEEDYKEITTLEAVFDCTSVVLLREDQDGRTPFLTLTPFIIDENAFEEKATIAKLYFLERYVREQDGYSYRHIYMLGDKPLLVKDQAYYAILKMQFDAFACLVFQQPMNST